MFQVRLKTFKGQTGIIF